VTTAKPHTENTTQIAVCCATILVQKSRSNFEEFFADASIDESLAE
jgi:hypothetical protein